MTPAAADRDGFCETAGAPAVRELLTGRRPLGVAQTTGAFIWLAFIAYPAINAFTRHGTTLHRSLTIAGAAAFVVAYIALVLVWRKRHSDRTLTALFALLVALAIALTLGDGGGWGFLFTYCAACAGLISARFGFAAVVACGGLAAVTTLVAGSSGNAIGWGASSLGIGMLLLVLRDLRIRNEQLTEARAELARLAVAEERERFARDLHDLLGHSLSLIALKSELAGRLLQARPEDAAHELRDVEAVARQALSEVRDAVSGYRQPTLDNELEGARVALAAAGIHTSLERAETALDPDREAVLAWAVREGVTNVIRHSHAQSCTLRVTSASAAAGVEVTDDGVGLGASNGHAGSGLAGLEERAREVGGSVETGVLAGGGFRLAVTIPAAAR